ncbi:hypothetical protein D3C72_1824970 [compost metagenome]
MVSLLMCCSVRVIVKGYCRPLRSPAQKKAIYLKPIILITAYRANIPRVKRDVATHPASCCLQQGEQYVTGSDLYPGHTGRSGPFGYGGSAYQQWAARPDDGRPAGNYG